MVARNRRFASAFDAKQFPLGEVRRHQVRDRVPVPSDQVRAMPFYHLVPKDPLEQVKWRWYVKDRGMRDARFRMWIDMCCKHDILFFANTFIYVFEPRPHPRYLPLNTWPDQDDHLVWMEECFGERDFLAEKSRGVGFTYDFLVQALKHWKYDDNCLMGFMSRDEDSVDKRNDPNTVMGKLDLMYAKMPVWWRSTPDGHDLCDRAVTDHRFRNISNGANCIGFGATGDATTGGRLTALYMDEFGKFKPGEDAYALQNTQNVTLSRFFISTFKGNSNEFSKMARPKPGKESTVLKVEADWKDNIERSRGLYTSLGGQLVKLDPGYEYPPNYVFILDGKIRSVYYDAECRRAGATPRGIAEELDRDPRGSTSKFFNDDAMRKASAHLCPPYTQGELVFDRNDLTKARFVPKADGRLKLWLRPAGDDAPWGGPYTLAADIAGGGGGDGSSNSCIQLIDQSRHEQVGVFVDNDILPTDLCDYAIALAHWLSSGRGEEMAYVGFENNGPLGSQFAKRLRKVGYGNLYWRETKDDTGKKRTKFLGYNNQDGGEELLSQMQKAISYSELIIHDADTVAEFDEYEYENGRVVHQASKQSEDGAAKGKPHGDRAISLGIAFHLHEDRPVAYNDPEKQPPPPGSVGAMYELEQEQRRRNSDPWQPMRDELAELMAPYGMY